MRPEYQTEQDARAELAVIHDVAAPRLLIAHRTPKFYPVDWFLEPFGGGVDRWWLCEVKVRERAYDTYMLSLHKFTTLLVMAASAGVVPMLIVAWKNREELGLCQVDEVKPEPGVGGRKDRSDDQDVEPVVFISRSAFSLEPFSPALREALTR